MADGPGPGPALEAPREPRLSRAAVEAVAGLSAGSAATLVVHPLDIVKTRMQIAKTTATGTAPSARAVLGSLFRARQPVRALYRGLTPNLLGNGTSWAAFFLLKSQAEAVLRRRRRTGTATRTGTGTGTERLAAGDYFVASAAAGAGVQALTNPLWVLKTRMLASDRGAAGAYGSMWAGARHVWQTEGVRGFYRGLGVSLLGVAHGAVQFAVYEPLRARLLGDKTTPTTRETLAVSTAAKLVAGTLTYPYQVVRSRLQNYDADVRYGRGIVGVARRLWRADGVLGFYRGVVPSVARVLPATWVTFLVYENIKFWLGSHVDD